MKMPSPCRYLNSSISTDVLVSSHCVLRHHYHNILLTKPGAVYHVTAGIDHDTCGIVERLPLKDDCISDICDKYQGDASFSLPSGVVSNRFVPFVKHIPGNQISHLVLTCPTRKLNVDP